MTVKGDLDLKIKGVTMVRSQSKSIKGVGIKPIKKDQYPNEP